MLSVKLGITVDALVEHVFEFLSDLTNYPKWSYIPYSRCYKRSAGSIREGTKFSLYVYDRMGGPELDMTVNEFIAGHRFGFEIHHPLGNVLRVRFELRPVENGTRIIERSALLRLPQQLDPLSFFFQAAWILPLAIPGRYFEVFRELRGIKQQLARERGMPP